MKTGQRYHAHQTTVNPQAGPNEHRNGALKTVGVDADRRLSQRFSLSTAQEIGQ